MKTRSRKKMSSPPWLTCFLFEIKTTKALESSLGDVVLTWSHNFHTFSSQKQAAYEHSAADGTKFMMSLSLDDRILPNKDPVDDWWVSLWEEAMAEVAVDDALGLELPPDVGEGFRDLGFSAMEVMMRRRSGDWFLMQRRWRNDGLFLMRQLQRQQQQWLRRFRRPLKPYHHVVKGKHRTTNW